MSTMCMWCRVPTSQRRCSDSPNRPEEQKAFLAMIGCETCALARPASRLVSYPRLLTIAYHGHWTVITVGCQTSKFEISIGDTGSSTGERAKEATTRVPWRTAHRWAPTAGFMAQTCHLNPDALGSTTQSTYLPSLFGAPTCMTHPRILCNE